MPGILKSVSKQYGNIDSFATPEKVKKALSVCYYGSYDLNEPHNSTYLAGLEKAGIQVREINNPPPPKRDESSKYDSKTQFIRFILKFLFNSIFSFFKLFRVNHLDAIIVGYPGYFDLLPAKIYSIFKRTPLIFNIHISLYETLVIDRQFFQKKTFMAKLLKWYDKLTIELSDAVLVDTQSHCDFFSRLYHIPIKKFHRIFIGADPIFRPTKPDIHNAVKVLFYGTFIPLQGIEYIVRAAKLLQKEPDIIFEIIGRGQTREKILCLAKQLRVNNIHFIEWVDRKELVQKIANADICLGGQFGMTPKADLVIGYKCYQMMACGKAIVVSNSSGNRELLTDGEDCCMCNPGNADDLAKAIMILKNDRMLRKKMEAAAKETFVSKCSSTQIGDDLSKIITVLYQTK